MAVRRDCIIYVGNLPPDVKQRDVEDLFYKFGRINYIDLKFTRSTPFAFIEYDDSREAREAVRTRDGYDFDGYRIRVELTRGVGPRGPGGRPMYSPENERRYSPPRRRGYPVTVSNLPPSGSWQDLKDHMRYAGPICYAVVYRGGVGVVEYTNYEDMKYALRKLDDTKFKSHEGETSYIRVEEGSSSSRSRSRSPRSSRRRYARSQSRSARSYSRERSRTPSDGDDRSPSHSRSRSATHSPDRSRSPTASRSRSSSHSSRSYSRSPS